MKSIQSALLLTLFLLLAAIAIVYGDENNTTSEHGNNTTTVEPQNGDYDNKSEFWDDTFEVKLYQNGTWRSVCYDSTVVSLLDGSIICEENGFNDYGSVYVWSSVVSTDCTANEIIALSNATCIENSGDINNCTKDNFERRYNCSKCLGIGCSKSRVYGCFGGDAGLHPAVVGFFSPFVLCIAIVSCVCCSRCRRNRLSRVTTSPRNKPPLDLPPSYESMFSNQESREPDESEQPPPSYDSLLSVMSQSSRPDINTTSYASAQSDDCGTWI